MSSRLDPYELVGRTLERYSVEGFMGFGRFSALYRGTDLDTHRPVAIRSPLAQLAERRLSRNKTRSLQGGS